jgi:putative heme-binding domain-containing protein
MGGGSVKVGSGLVLFAMAIAVGSQSRAQHATAFDIEDGGRAFERSCASCHGPDGNLIAGIDFGRGVFRRPLSDAEIVEIIVNGIPDTPMPATPGLSEEQARRIVAYLRSLPGSGSESAVRGDAARGREIVTGSGECLDCHRVAGRGSRLGPDLSAIGLERRAVEIEQSLLDPDAEVQPENRFYEVRPKRGEPVVGRLLNHDTFTVQILDENERLRSFAKSDLEYFRFAEPPMPSYRDRLDAQSIADVVSFLVSLRGEPVE